MRLSKTVSITLPPEMLARAVAMAQAEHRTMSELIREALRHYEASRAGNMTEADVVYAVRETRAPLWQAYKKHPSPAKRSRKNPKA